MYAIVGASVREAQLEPGVEPTDNRKRRARLVMMAAFLFVVGVVWLGDRWWKSEAADYGAYIYKPLQMQATLDGGNYLTLKLSDPGWIKSRRIDDFVADHNHLMHLYAIRQPGLDVVYHLHPELGEPGVFKHALPAMPAGEYRLYADVVHQSGLPETSSQPSPCRRSKDRLSLATTQPVPLPRPVRRQCSAPSSRYLMATR